MKSCSQSQRLALTGSSARKLKRGAANLLAGRTLTYRMYPLTYLELANAFRFEDYLRWVALVHGV
jgi:predicted AAA+ superfamily ATPase